MINESYPIRTAMGDATAGVGEVLYLWAGTAGTYAADEDAEVVAIARPPYRRAFWEAGRGEDLDALTEVQAAEGGSREESARHRYTVNTPVGILQAVDELELTPAARRVLDAAGELFYSEGINAVGVDTIAKRAGVTKKTLYDRFGSKDQLIVSYLRERDVRWRRWLTAEVERIGDDPAARLLATFEAQRTWMARESPRGCSFVNAAAELPDPGHPARAVIRSQKQWLRTYLFEHCRAAGSSDPEQLADELVLLHEGASVLTGLTLTADPWTTAGLMAASALADQGVGSATGRNIPM